jgi:hypothetical protein
LWNHRRFAESALISGKSIRSVCLSSSLYIETIWVNAIREIGRSPLRTFTASA